MGEEAYRRAATPEEIARMQSVVAEAMAGGAAGFASSASPHAQRRPGSPRCRPGWPIWPNCASCSSPCAGPGAGWWPCCPEGVLSHQEVFDLQREIRRPFTWTALLDGEGLPLPTRR